VLERLSEIPQRRHEPSEVHPCHSPRNPRVCRRSGRSGPDDTNGHRRTSEDTRRTDDYDQRHTPPICTGIRDTAASVVNPNYLPKSGSTHGPSHGWEKRGPLVRIAARLCDAAVGLRGVARAHPARPGYPCSYVKPLIEVALWRCARRRRGGRGRRRRRVVV
jgi:hypothetical protein